MEHLITVRELFKNTAEYAGKEITVAGWARTIRDSKAFGFIELNDGSNFGNLQVVMAREAVDNYDLIASHAENACL